MEFVRVVFEISLQNATHAMYFDLGLLPQSACARRIDQLIAFSPPPTTTKIIDNYIAAGAKNIRISFR
jgi:hypothetical protein